MVQTGAVCELVKHHVMTDVFHVLTHGHQAIGGELEPWPYGPVVEPAYNRLKHWEHEHEATGGVVQPPEYEILDGELAAYQPRANFDPQDMSPAELDAMKRAADLLRPMSFDEAYRFFRDGGSFMGRAYNLARGRIGRWPGGISSMPTTRLTAQISNTSSGGSFRTDKRTVDSLPPRPNNTPMSTVAVTDLKADLEVLCQGVAGGLAVDPEILRRIRERAEEVQEELRARGPSDVAEDLVRESRDE